MFLCGATKVEEEEEDQRKTGTYWLMREEKKKSTRVRETQPYIQQSLGASAMLGSCPGELFIPASPRCDGHTSGLSIVRMANQ